MLKSVTVNTTTNEITVETVGTQGRPGTDGALGVTLTGDYDPDRGYVAGEGVYFGYSSFAAKRVVAAGVEPQFDVDSRPLETADWRVVAAGVQGTPGNLTAEAVALIEAAQVAAETASLYGATRVTAQGAVICQTIGSAVTPVDGSVLSAKTYVMGTPVAFSGYLSDIRLYAKAPGTIYVKRFTKSGDTFTQVGSDYPVSITGTGSININTAVFGSIPVVKAEYIGFYANGPLAVVVTTADQGGFFDSGGGNVASFTDATASTSGQTQIGFDLVPLQDGTFQNTNRLASLEAQDPDTAAITKTYGRPVGSVLVTGTAINARTYAWSEASLRKSYVTAIRYYSLRGGLLLIKRFTKAGDTFTQVGSDYPLFLLPGYNVATVKNFGAIVLNVGEYLGFYANGAFVYATGTGDSGGLYDSGTANGTGNFSTFDDTTTSNTVQLQIGFDMADAAALSDAVAAVSDDVEALQLALSDAYTDTFGRTETPVTGPFTFAYTVAYVTPAARAGSIKRVNVFALAPGNLYACVFNRSGDTFTVAASSVMAVSSTGLQSFDADNGDFTALAVAVGQYVGYMASSNMVPYSTATSDNGGYYRSNSTSSTPQSFTDSTASTTTRPEIGLEVDGVEMRDILAQLDTILAGGGVGSTDNERRLPTDYKITLAGLMQMVGYGQSNDDGTDAAVITTTPSIRHKTFGVGVTATKPGITDGLNPSDGTFKALVSETTTPIDGATCGETLFPTSAKETYRRMMQTAGEAPVFFASAAGKPGNGIANIGITSAWYENLRYHMQQAYAYAVSHSLTYAVFSVDMDHGEFDQNHSTSKATYKAGLIALIDGFKAHTLADTGYAGPIHWLFTVSTENIRISAGATEAILELCEPRSRGGRSDCHLYASEHRFPHVNSYHLSGVGQALKGAYNARAKAQLYNGYVPDRVRWISVTALGRVVSFWAEAPSALQVNAAIVGGTTTQNGFYVADDTGELTLTSIAAGAAVFDEVSGLYRTAISMTCHRDLGANPVGNYARNYMSSALTIVSGASGDVYDTTSETVVINGTTYPMPHVAPPLSRSITIIE